MKHNTLLMMVGLLLLTFWLGARSLDADAIWNDEFYSIYDAGGSIYGPRSPADIWTGLAQRNPWHAPGFFFILSGWGALVGWQPPVLRALSLLFGVLAVAWTYRIGRDWIAPSAGIYAAAALGLSAFYIHYLHELRMYTLLVLLAAFTLWVYLRIVHVPAPPRRWLWGGLLIGAAGLIYTHYYASLVLIAIGIHHLTLLRSTLPRRHWLTVIGVLLLAGLLFLPWMGTLLAGLALAAESSQLHERALTPAEALARIAYLFGNGAGMTALIALALALLGSAALYREPRFRRGLFNLWFFALILLALLLAANLLLRIMHEGRLRYLLLLWTPLALLAGIGLFGLGRWLRPAGRWLAPALLAGWFAIGVVSATSAAFTANLDGARYDFPLDVISARLRDDVQADDVVVSYLPDGSPIWVAERNQDIAGFYFSGVPFVSSTMRMPNTPDLRDDSLEYTRQSLGGRLRVWLSYRVDELRPLMFDDLVSAMQDDGYALCQTALDGAVARIDLYTLEPLCCAQYGRTQPALLRYGDVITLTGLQLGAVEADGLLPLVMTWAQAEHVPPYTYSVALHVWDADGKVVAQTDYGLEIPATTCQRAYLPVGDLAAATYQLRAAVYNWQTGERLPGVTADDERGDMLLVTTLEIE